MNMRPSSLSFVAVLWVTVISTFLLFSSKIIPWVQFHYFSEPATLFYRQEPEINSADEARKQMREIEKRGSAIVLRLDSGKSISTYARVISDENHHTAQTKEGLRVFFVKNGSETVRIVNNLADIDSPWLWFVLFIALLLVSSFATKFYIREANERSAA